MTDIALRYRVSPKILGAAQRLACRSQWEGGASKLRYLLPLFALGVLLCDLFIHPSKYWIYFIMTCGVAYLQYFLLRARRLRRRISAEWGEISLLAQEDGLQITQGHIQTLYFWPCMREIREIPAKRQKSEQKSGQENAWVAVILDSAQGQVLPIPFAAFADAAARQAFVAAVKAGIEQARRDG
ncbi:MAG: hypothetical protein LBD68_05275 [Zoogloeaceae bacterium]|jgi:hypothetical protein|nr:hypothetical protein [Zoogloeaceae bacterium]